MKSLLVINNKAELQALQRAAQQSFDYLNNTLYDDLFHECKHLDPQIIDRLRIKLDQRIDQLLDAARLSDRINQINLLPNKE